MYGFVSLTHTLPWCRESQSFYGMSPNQASLIKSLRIIFGYPHLKKKPILDSLFSSRKQPSFEVHLKQCQYPKKPKHGQATCLEISQKVGWEDQIIFHNDQTFHAPAACKENHTMSACKPGCSMSVQEVTPPTEHPDELELVKCHKYFRQVHTVTFDQSHKNI